MKYIRVFVASFIASLIVCIACNYNVNQDKPTTASIESTDITGMYEGTISISGKDREEICVEGAIRIDDDGDQIRITMSDAVDSIFNKEF